jgi:hypothetical protein
LFKPAVHAIGDDVEKCQNADLRAIHDLFFFKKKGVRSGSSGVHDGGGAGDQSQIGGNAERLKMGPGCGGKPVEGGAAVTDVVVDVDEPRNDVQASHVNNFLGLTRRNVFLDGGDFSRSDRNVEVRVNLVGRIDDMPAFQNQVVGRRLPGVWRAPAKREYRSESELRQKAEN